MMAAIAVAMFLTACESEPKLLDGDIQLRAACPSDTILRVVDPTAKTWQYPSGTVDLEYITNGLNNTDPDYVEYTVQKTVVSNGSETAGAEALIASSIADFWEQEFSNSAISIEAEMSYTQATLAYLAVDVCIENDDDCDWPWHEMILVFHDDRGQHSTHASGWGVDHDSGRWGCRSLSGATDSTDGSGFTCNCN